MAKKPKEAPVNTEQSTDQTAPAAEAVAQQPEGGEAKPVATRGPRGTPETAPITLKVTENPKRVGSKAHARFALYSNYMTVKEFLDSGGTTPDLVYDAKHGFIEIAGYNPGEVIQPKPKKEPKPKAEKKARAPKPDPVAAAEDAVETNEEVMS